jgi:hypothetical protein
MGNFENFNDPLGFIKFGTGSAISLFIGLVHKFVDKKTIIQSIG